ncbi:MAG: DUF1573 domain-containing protein [Bacteroidales bacterium]|nr:DUF1573 domain-containing protein [Bacteroidales bacterium]
MKKILTSVLFFGAIFTLSCSQTPTQGETADVFGPGIEFSETEHDFGTIEYDGDATIDFVFKNTGTEPLILSNVRSSCGCTVPQWPREPINPGQDSAIKVKYNTKRVGTFSKSVTVYSNAQEAPIILRIKGKVEPQPQPAAAAIE